MAVDGLGADRHRAAGAQSDLAGDVAGLGALGQHRTPNDIVDLAGVDPGTLDGGRKRERAEGRSGRRVERSAIGAADRCAGG